MSWSRTNRTLYRSSRSLISAKSAASRAALARLTLRSSAPMVAVSGTTSMAFGPTWNVGTASGARLGDTTVCMGFSDRVWGGGLAQAEDRGPDAAAGLEVPVGGDGVLQRVAPVDPDGDAPGADVVEELADQRRALRRVGDVVGQRRAGDEERALDRQLHRVDRRDRAGRRAEADQQPAPAQRVERGRDGGATDAVERDR